MVGICWRIKDEALFTMVASSSQQLAEEDNDTGGLLHLYVFVDT